MSARLDYARVAPGLYEAMDALDQHTARSGLEESLLHLVRLRASQLNGCAYCLDLHGRDLLALGEPVHRLTGLDAWRECPWYTPRERAALAWTEAVTRIADGHADDAVFGATRDAFGDRDLAELTLAIVTINAWNRLSIVARLEPRGTQPAGATA